MEVVSEVVVFVKVVSVLLTVTDDVPVEVVSDQVVKVVEIVDVDESVVVDFVILVCEVDV
jgi:hypothetical protein